MQMRKEENAIRLDLGWRPADPGPLAQEMFPPTTKEAKQREATGAKQEEEKLPAEPVGEWQENKALVLREMAKLDIREVIRPRKNESCVVREGGQSDVISHCCSISHIATFPFSILIQRALIHTCHDICPIQSVQFTVNMKVDSS